VGLRAGLEPVGKRKFLTLPGFELRPLGRPDDGDCFEEVYWPTSLRKFPAYRAHVAHKMNSTANRDR
jgi:hypothetical protein